MKETKFPEPLGAGESADCPSARTVAFIALFLNLILFIGFIVQTVGVHEFKDQIKKMEEAAQQRQEIQQVVEAVLQQQGR